MTIAALTALCFNMSEAVKDDGFWLPMIPAGQFKGIDGRSWNNANPDAVIANFNKKRPFDVEHSTHIKAPQGEPAPACGWIIKLENRDGTIWGLIKWNKDGQDLVDNEKYAFYSPAFQYTQTGIVLALTSAGLTNDPNLDVPALNNRQEDNDMKLHQLIAAALGLADTASVDDAVVAINSLKSDRDVALNSAQHPSLDKFVPKETYDLALNRATTAEGALAEIEGEKIEALVDSAIEAGKVAPKDKDMYVGLCSTQAGRKQFESFVESAPEIVAREGIKTPEGIATNSKLEEHEIALCRKMGISQEEYLAEKAKMNKE